MQPGLILAELDGRQFLANLEACANVYAAAMNPPAEQLPGRYTIMERHAGYAAFRAITALALPTDGKPASTERASGGPASSQPADSEPASSQPADSQRADSQPASSQPASSQPASSQRADSQPASSQPASSQRADGQPADGQPADGQQAVPGPAPLLVGFAYGFHGGRGQWWHDVVSRAVTSVSGAGTADAWFGDSLEIAEVHVLPRYQGHGTGLAMVLRLTAGRPERAAVLSTMDADTRARRLYRGLGFTDLLTGFRFPGTELPYAIMGAPLPLPGAAPRQSRPDRPSRW